VSAQSSGRTAARVVIVLVLTWSVVSCWSGGDDGASPTSDTGATTTERQATAEQFASIVAEHRDELAALEQWRADDCSLDGDDDPICLDVHDLDDVVSFGLQAVAFRFDQLAPPAPDVEKLVRRTTRLAEVMEEATDKLNTCQTANPGDSNEALHACEREFGRSFLYLNMVLELLDAWSPYL
jgi:hypothetical protein